MCNIETCRYALVKANLFNRVHTTSHLQHKEPSMISFTNQNHLANKAKMLGSCIATLSLLTACGGSGAGDNNNEEGISNNTAEAITAITTVVGTWDLPDNWKGEENDEAYLVIRTPGEDGEADALIYDFNDGNSGFTEENCYFIDGAEGSASYSISNQIFLDIGAFPDAIVSLSASNNLDINYTSGLSTGIDRETKTITATTVGLTEVDLVPLCET